MKDELAASNITMIALSKDDVETTAEHKRQDGLSMALLSDPELNVIRQYGVEHHKAIEVSGATVNLFGIRAGFTPSIKTMAIPTTLLIDEEGTVRWIDQTDDYRMRSHNERILEKVGEVFSVTNQAQSEN